MFEEYLDKPWDEALFDKIIQADLMIDKLPHGFGDLKTALDIFRKYFPHTNHYESTPRALFLTELYTVWAERVANFEKEMTI